MKCPNCGSKIIEGSAFCENCGAPVPEQKKQEKGSFCPFCGAWNEGDDRFCAECGRDLAEVEDEMEEIYPDDTRAPKKSNKALVIVICILAAVIVIGGAAGGGYFYFHQKQVKAEEEREAEKEAKEEEEAKKKAEEEEQEKKEQEEKETEEEQEKEDEKKKEEEDEKDKDKEKDEEDRLEADYILPNSSSVLLTQSDISGLTLQELNYARNEIFARHGRRFSSQELQQYFDSKSWYNGTISPEDFDANYTGTLSEVEKKNIDLLKAEEYGRASSGYQLDQ